MDIVMNAPKAAVVGSGITPQMPQEPTPEAKAMVFEMPSADLIGKEASTVIKIDGQQIKEEKGNADERVVQPTVEAVKKTDEVKKEEVPKKEEVKSVLKPPTTDTKKDEKATEVKLKDKLPIAPITPVKEKATDTFDYSKYSSQEQGMLRKMANEAKVEYARLIDENKQLSSLKDATYLQHEQGYTLSPDYQALNQKAVLANVEGQAWRDALLAIKAGKPFKPIIGFNKDGSAKLGAEIQPTDEHELQVSQNLQACSQEVNRLSGELNVYPQRFKNQVQNDLAVMQQVQREKFSWEADPKLLDYSVEVEGQGEQKIRDIQAGFKSMFPPYLANTPGVHVAANLMVAMIIQGAELRQLRNQSQVATIKLDEAARGEPTSDNSPTAVAAKKDKNGNVIPSSFSLEGIPD